MQANHPPKEAVRDYLQRRAKDESPPPKPDDVRRELGWHLIPSNGPVQEVPE
jgi:hypothetical protein